MSMPSVLKSGFSPRLYRLHQTICGLSTNVKSCRCSSLLPGISRLHEHDQVHFCCLIVFIASCFQQEAMNTIKQQKCTWSCSRSEEHTSELQSRQYLVCRLLLDKKNAD